MTAVGVVRCPRAEDLLAQCEIAMGEAVRLVFAMLFSMRFRFAATLYARCIFICASQ